MSVIIQCPACCTARNLLKIQRNKNRACTESLHQIIKGLFYQQQKKNRNLSILLKRLCEMLTIVGAVTCVSAKQNFTVGSKYFRKNNRV